MTRAQRAEQLVRSLVGVEDVLVVATPSGDVARVHVSATPGSSPRQAARNAASALLAGLGLQLPRELVTGHAGAELDGIRAALRAARGDDVRPLMTPPAVAPRVELPEPEPAAPAAPPPAMPLHAGGSNGHGNGAHAGQGNGNGVNRIHGNGHRNGHGHAGGEAAAYRSSAWAPPARMLAPLPLPAQLAASNLDVRDAAAIRAVDVRRIGESVFVQVTIAAHGQLFAGAGEAAADGTPQLLNLVARVTVEAVRANMSNAGGLQFDGAALAEVSGRPHVVVALQAWRNGSIQALAGAAPILDRMEDAAARAALGALRELI